MMERDQRLQPPFPARLGNVHVPVECSGIYLSLVWFYSGPLYAEPERITAHCGYEVKHLFISVPKINSYAGRLDLSCHLPPEPVVCGLSRPVETSLYLEASRSDPKMKSVG